MNIDAIKYTLRKKFHHLEEVAPDILCATDKYQNKPYAVRYFDLSGNITKHSEGLTEYLETILAKDYFDIRRPIDLRWNNYLYFITSDKDYGHEAYLRAKTVIESDREYARKFVITESELSSSLQLLPQEKAEHAPTKDIYNTWLQLLNEHQLGYILDFNLSVPEIIRKIISGDSEKLEQATPVGKLTKAEHDAITHPIQTFTKTGFRKYPKENVFQFGSHVNLITGPNGHGKTSLLEAIEYLYCGSTYRNGAPSESTHITASLANSPETLETSSQNNNTRHLRARNLAWYGKNDVRGSSLEKSFSRFNFMDTDAAIRVSVDDTAKHLSDDIAHIVLGAEAGKASDKIQRVYVELDKQLKKNGNERAQLDSSIGHFTKELNALSTMTKQSDTLFEQLNQRLLSMHWVELPQSANVVAITALSELLSNADHHCRLLEGTPPKDLTTRRQELESYSTSLSALVKTASNIGAEVKSLTLKKNLISEKLNNIDELNNYAGSDILNLSQRQKRLTTTINSLQAKLPNLPRTDLISNEIATLPLDNALSLTANKLTEVRSKKAEIQTRIDEHEHSQSRMESLHEQLVATATTLLSSLPDKDHCPLCRSKFEQGQLMLRITNGNKHASAPRSTELRNTLADLQKNESELKQLDSILSAIHSYDGYSSTTVTTALTKIREDHDRLLDSQEDLKTISSKLTQYSEKGLNANRMRELMQYLALHEYNSEALKSSQTSLQADLVVDTKVLNNKKALLDTNIQEISKLAEMAGHSELSSTAALNKAIAFEIKKHDEKLFAAKQLASYIEPKLDFSPTSLSHRINEAHEIASKLITTLMQEKETSSRFKELNKKVEEANSLFDIKTGDFNNLKTVRGIISDLLEGDNSLESIKYELLVSHGTTISEIFSEIHHPNEYDLSFNAKQIKLTHKVSGEIRSLNEVSTGQRAAFALSLFLTMNKTLKNGPKILILDDPISHIDDINMLSFLDYLRDLAIDGSRQIFFATPNTKLASIFRHKFSFLNESEFKEIQMSR